MPKLLVVETSPRGERSISRTLTRQFVESWKNAHPGGEVRRRDLTETPLRFLDAPWLAAYFTPAGAETVETRAALRLSDELVGELLDADHVAIGTPVYNFNVPAALKAWVDHVVRKGVTIGPDGRGLVTGRKATVLLASGGVYGAGSPIADRDLATSYLRLILDVLGITDVTFVAGGGAKAVDLGEATMAGFAERLAPEIERAALR